MEKDSLWNIMPSGEVLDRRISMRSCSENFKLLAWLCVLVLIELTASWSIAASSNDLFTPAVARNLDGEIEDIAKRNNLPSVASACLSLAKADTRLLKDSRI
jgi:hypothetical protein